MSQNIDVHRGADAAASVRRDLRLSGALFVLGLLIDMVRNMIHPSGAEDTHKVIFTKYAESGSWGAIHLGEFVGVSLALAGLLVLYRAMRSAGQSPLIPHLAAAGTIATAAVWAVLQGLDGVALKQAVDAWNSASGPEKTIRFANAETLRWLEWGTQCYFRVLLGFSFVLFGAAILAGRLTAGWLGWVAILAGVLSAVIGVDAGYSGLASPLQDVLSIPFLVAIFVFGIGVLVTGMRQRT